MKKISAWIWSAVAWFTFGLIDSTRTVFVMYEEGMHHDWPALFLVLMLSWLVWAIATPLVVRIGRKRWWIHPFACLAIGVVSAGWLAGLEWLFNPWAAPERLFNPWDAPKMAAFLPLWQERLGENLTAYIVLYGVILMVAYGLRSREKMARQGELLAQARLDALRRQIEPHFLFNSLNAIVSLIREGRPADAIDVTVGLGELLRRLLDESGRTLVPLFEEFDLLGKYLDIQKLRYDDRLTISIDRPSELAMAQVPALVLQPLAENALKHGIGRRVEGGLLDIKVARDDGVLTIRVENDAPPLPADLQDGIGLSNIRARLASLYGEQAGLAIGAGAPGKVLVTVSLPYRSSP